MAALFHTIMSVSYISAYAQGRLEAQYGITMTGVPIGHIAWHVDIGNNFYATSANGKASGVLSVLMNGEGSVARERQSRERADDSDKFHVEHY
jgi:hypothetical protein